MLKGKTVLLGVTGSIAAYKIAYLASALKKLHAECTCADDEECNELHYIRLHLNRLPERNVW